MVGSPNRDRQAERREATRQEILAAAWEIAHESGLISVTLREIAARVGMQPPSLYSHFASKNAIYDAMFGQAWRDFHAVLEKEAASFSADPRGRLLATWGARTSIRRQRPGTAPADGHADAAGLQPERGGLPARGGVLRLHAVGPG